MIDLSFEKGKFNPMRKPETEGSICELTPNGLLLNMYLKKPSPKEADVFAEGKDFYAGILSKEGIMFLIFEVNHLLAMECPFDITAYHPIVFLNTGNSPRRLLLRMVLTDHDTNIIKAVRTVKLPEKFIQEFWAQVQIQYRLQQPEEQKNTIIEELYQKHPVGCMKFAAQLYTNVLQ